MALFAFVVTLVVLLAVIVIYDSAMIELRLKSEMQTKTVLNLVDANSQLKVQNKLLQDEIQIESVKAAYYENSLKKLDETSQHLQEALINNEARAEKIYAEYQALLDAFAETLANG